MADSPPHLYRREGVARGVPESVIDAALRDTSAARTHGSEPILSLGHLAHLTGVEYGFLREIVERGIDPYSDIVLRKRTGGARAIAAPGARLMSVQRWILASSLTAQRPHSASFAYQNGRSSVQCAQVHIGARWMVKLDLHDFFHSIGEGRAYRVFRECGYSALVAFELARVCTRPAAGREGRMALDRYDAIPVYAIGATGVLPQGAPTSGALANLVMRPLDVALDEIACSIGANYTRYSDDLTFSFSGSFSRERGRSLIRDVTARVGQQGLVIHRKKTRVVPPGARKVVLGLLVDEDRVRLLPEFRRRVEGHIRGVRRFGLVEHARARRFRSVLSFIAHVDGCLAYAADVDAHWVGVQRERWVEALRASGLPS